MIRYSITEKELERRITAEKKSWLSRAKKRTTQYRKGGVDPKESHFWGEIKKVYIQLQHSKCGYCETGLQDGVLASKVHEVEHFRPKGRISAWPNKKAVNCKKLRHCAPMGDARSTGYSLLAYHPLNYVIACTRCNSTLKSDYFPIAHIRMVKAQHPKRMRKESALLIYPISDIDRHDPSDLISFNGPFAVAKHRSGFAHQRAMTNIHFFMLNHEDLILRRSKMLMHLWASLDARVVTDEDREHRQLCIDECCLPSGEFSACANAFQALFHDDRPRASRYIHLIRKLVKSRR